MDVTTAQAWRGFECLKCSVCLQWFSGLICSVEAEVWAGNVNKPLWSIKDLWIFPPPASFAGGLSAKWLNEEQNGLGGFSFSTLW